MTSKAPGGIKSNSVTQDMGALILSYNGSEIN